jgi:hypothetical protein
LQFKEQVLFKLKNKISAVQCEKKTFRLIPLLTPVDSRWTIPLIKSMYLLGFFPCKAGLFRHFGHFFTGIILLPVLFAE